MKNIIHSIEELRQIIRTSDNKIYFDFNNKGYSEKNLVLIKEDVSGNVSSSTLLGVNSLIRGNGGNLIKSSGILINDNDDISQVRNISTTGTVNGRNIGADGLLIDSAEQTANKGTINGYASLDGSGKVPSSQLPSYVDDVEEYANLAGFPATGETGKIYVAQDTNKQYRWSGSSYIEVSPNIYSTDTEIETAYNNRVSLVTQAEAEAGTSTTVKRWTPERVKQAIDALGSGASSVSTWTPTISFNDNAVGVTYGIRKGSYITMGDFVFFSVNITVSNKGSSTGDIKIHGLPHSIASAFLTTNFTVDVFNIVAGIVDSHVTATGAAGTDYIQISSGGTLLDDADINNGFNAVIQGFYQK